MKRNIEETLKDNATKNRVLRPSTDPSAVNGKSHFETDGDDTIISAKAEFLRRVSNSISYLIDRQGYSRSRASELILGEIRKDSPLPSEDETFSVMEKYHLGMNEAREVIVISNALKKIRKDQNFSATKAIGMLTSSLTTMKILGKVESQNQVFLDQTDIVDSSNCSSQSSPSSPSSPSPNTTSGTSSPKSFLSVVEKMNENSAPPMPSTSTPPSERSLTNSIPSRKRGFCKRAKEEVQTIPKTSTKDGDDAGADDDDAERLKVSHKVILQKQERSGLSNSSSSAPTSTSNTRMKSPSPREKRELDNIIEGQPKTKRQRLDSI